MSNSTSASEATTERDDKAARKARKAAKKAAKEVAKKAERAAKEAERSAKEAEKAARKTAKAAAKAAKEAAKEAAKDAAKDAAKEEARADGGAQEVERADASAPASGKVAFEGSMARDEAVAYFSSIVEGLRAGTVSFQHGDDQAAFPNLPEQLMVSVSAARKSDKSRIEFSLSWRESARQRLTIVADE